MNRFFIFLLLFGCSAERLPTLPVGENFMLQKIARSTVCLSNTVDVNLLTGACGDRVVALPALTLGYNYTALSDPNHGVYATFLYDGSNIPPKGHLVVGDSVALTIRPISGKIKIVCEGMSSARLVFGAFISQLASSMLDNSALQVVDLSQSGCDLNCWVGKGVGIIDSSVQIVLWYHSNNRPQLGCSKIFPDHALATQAQLEQRLGQIKKKYPNLKQLYVGFREFGGWSCPPSGTELREPVAYEEGFSVKWFTRNHFAEAAPFIGLGPYTWSSLTPRSWFRDDGVHLCSVGAGFMGKKWFDFLLNNSTSRPWFAQNP